MEAAAHQIRDGKSVIIFPEGTRTRDGRLLPFKRGGFLLAARAGVPVVPVTINGSFQINPGGALRLYGGSVTIRIQPPLTVPEGMKRSSAEEYLLTQVRSSIEQGLTKP
jgi:1-acyl-sn-glycerol-3-phosphate acyltransferase